MIYKLNNMPISAFGARPGKGIGFFALSGMLDLPKRKGKTEHNWGTSIEPFVHHSDIQFENRVFTFVAVMEKSNLEAYKAACVDCDILSFDYDYFNVKCVDEIEVDEIGGFCVVVSKFIQNDFSLKPISTTPSGTGLFKIDNFNLTKDFGIYVNKTNGLLDEPKRIEVNTTEFYTITSYRGAVEVSIECYMKDDNFESIYSKMNQFQSVLMSPGIRTLTLGDKQMNVYFKDGIQVNILHPKILQFTIKATKI